MSDLLLTDFDLHLLAEGTHYRTYEKLGAHLRERAGVAGIVVEAVHDFAAADGGTRERDVAHPQAGRVLQKNMIEL